MFTDPATSLFIGFFANGAATLINSALVSNVSCMILNVALTIA